MFSHEKLDVYKLAVDFQRSVHAQILGWDKRFAVTDQLLRASESIVMNIATGTSLRLGKAKIQKLDYAIGSTLESAACIDIAQIKGATNRSETTHYKECLAAIASKTVALRKSWETRLVREPAPEYGAKKEREPLFLHEKLDVYQVSLRFNQWFADVESGNRLSARPFRMIDSPACSLALNIAEGNGRFAVLDHAKFLEIAKTAAVKAAAGLDLVFEKDQDSEIGAGDGKRLLERCVAMLVRMIESQRASLQAR